ncbi:MAG TPA: NnrS family protein [Caulobacteraceae bacterium]|nr:NnrS family protein [Caulobacteraceae bacterium]
MSDRREYGGAHAPKRFWRVEPPRAIPRSVVIEARGREQPLWSAAFRPFFLAAAAWSAGAILLWIGLYMHGGATPSRFDPLTWHIHEMLFGFVPAAIAGFLLTAIANWTGRSPIRGSLLAALAALWLAGRIAVFFSALLPAWVAPAVDLAFPAALFALAAREIVAARSWRNLMMLAPLAVLTAADALMFLESAGAAIPHGLGWRLAIAAIITLVSAIGGRIIPAFTRNWLVLRGASELPNTHSLFDSVSLAALHTGLLAWAFFPASTLVGALLLIAAALTALRLARWRGWATAAEPLLAILHVGYAWIAIGAALLGASILTSLAPQEAAVHAFTAGVMGTMVLAITTRVARGHTGRRLEADRVTASIYVLVSAAAVARVAAPFLPTLAITLLTASAALWAASFLTFLAAYGPMLVRPRLA